jgi:hypothetical protein
MSLRWLLLAVAIPAASFAQTNPIDIGQARAYFDEVRRLGSADGGKIWGMRVDGPMFFVDPQSRQIIANMPDSAGTWREQDGVWLGALTPEQSPANTAVKWAGRHWSMVMWPVSDNRYSRGRLLMHESFHRIQSDLGLPGSDRANSHLATADGRIWTRLEWRALVESLLRNGNERKQALADALTFRAKRQSLFPSAPDEERLLELNEGLAEYTGYALSGLPRSALYDRLAVQLANYEQQENYSRNFAYASGPAYALLLDASGRQWRKGLDLKSSLTALAARAYGITHIDPATADARSQRYTPARMIADERTKEKRRLEREATLRAKFIDGPTITLPAAGAFNYSFDPNGATPLQNAGTVFESSRVTDEWGVLNVTSGGVLMRRVNGPITAAIVVSPAGDNPSLKGDGWDLQLNPGWSLRPGEKKGYWILQRDK